jgi:hypothetical protein
MILQLNPPIWVQTPLGEGDCLVLIDYGPNLNTVWLVHLFDDGRVLHFDSSDIRAMGNLMYGIAHPSPPEPRIRPFSPAVDIGHPQAPNGPQNANAEPVDSSPVCEES